MRGRSRITFKQNTQCAFKGLGKQAEQEEVTILKMLNDITSAHTVLGNKLKRTANRMLTNERNNL